MLAGREPAERLRDAPRAEPPHPLVEGRRELARPDPGPVPTAEELLPQQAGEALGAGVVAAPALARHAAGQAGGLAYRDPPRSSRQRGFYQPRARGAVRTPIRTYSVRPFARTPPSEESPPWSSPAIQQPSPVIFMAI